MNKWINSTVRVTTRRTIASNFFDLRKLFHRGSSLIRAPQGDKGWPISTSCKQKKKKKRRRRHTTPLHAHKDDAHTVDEDVASVQLTSACQTGAAQSWLNVFKFKDFTAAAAAVAEVSKEKSLHHWYPAAACISFFFFFLFGRDVTFSNPGLNSNQLSGGLWRTPPKVK